MLPSVLGTKRGDAAIQFEKPGNQLVAVDDMDILCGSSLGRLQSGADNHIFEKIYAEHSAVHSRGNVNDPDSPH
jgi:hypothetical protein